MESKNTHHVPPDTGALAQTCNIVCIEYCIQKLCCMCMHVGYVCSKHSTCSLPEEVSVFVHIR